MKYLAHDFECGRQSYAHILGGGGSALWDSQALKLYQEKMEMKGLYACCVIITYLMNTHLKFQRYEA